MKINGTKLGIQYCLLHSSYWMAYCAVYGFAAVFLLDRGFKNSEVGVVIALGNILGAILQPVFASVADSSRKLPLHRLTLLLAAAALILRVVLLVSPRLLLPTAILFIASDALIQVLQPMISSISVYYINHGINVNFGVARGIGSVSYAAMSSVLGVLTDRFHATAVVVISIILMFAMIMAVVSLPVLGSEEGAEEFRPEAVKLPEARDNFFHHYRRFLVALAGLTCLYCTHFMINNFMIQIVTPMGGTSAQLGRAMSIPALVELPVMFGFSKLVRRFSSRKLLMFSAVMFSVKASCFMLAGNISAVYLIQMLQMFAFAICVPASVYYVNELMDDCDKFKGQAVMAGTNTLGGAMGSLLGGILLDAGGVSYMVMVSTVISAAGTLILLLALEKTPKEKQSEKMRKQRLSY